MQLSHETSHRLGRPLVGLALVAAIAGVSPVALAEVTVGHHVRPMPRAEMDRGARLHKQLLLPTDRLRMSDEPFTAVADLGPFDATTLLEEDANAGFGPLRIGVARNMGVNEADGAWQRIPGEGWLWTVAVRSRDAIAMRLEFENINLPDGASLFVRDASGLGDIVGPIERQGDNGTGWQITPDLLGDVALVEYFVPGDTAQPPVRHFDIADVHHIYNPIFIGILDDLREGACHNDVTCYPAWATQKQAVARITFTSGGGTFLCSGALISTSTADETPYFVTANHCIDTESEANSMTARWFFQTTTCNGTVSNGLTSGNATLVAQSDETTGADQTLLEIRGALQFGVTWMGWTSAIVLNNVDCTNIHHPDGAHKRISFGRTETHSFGDPTDFNGIRFDNPGGGTIEGGSSGSPCFRDSDGLFFSVCSHGPVGSSCTNMPWGPFGYGRFSRFYPSITSQMTASPDDAFEPNDDCSNATPDPGTGSFTNRIVKSTSEDWIAFDLDGCERLSVTATFTASWGDIDLELYDACGGIVVDSATGTSGSENVTFDNFGGPATYYLRVYLDGPDTRATYTMNVTKTSLGTPPSITDQPDTQTVDEGDPVSLSVTATGTAPLTYQWKKDGGDLGGETGSTLNIASAVPGDAGDYTCVVTNDCDSLESDVATVTVNSSGLTADFDGDGDVDTGDFAVFAQCFAGSGNPPAGSCPGGVDADLDDDGDVDTADFALLAQQFTGSM